MKGLSQDKPFIPHLLLPVPCTSRNLNSSTLLLLLSSSLLQGSGGGQGRDVVAFCWFRAGIDVMVGTGDGLVKPSGLADKALPTGTHPRGTETQTPWEMCKRVCSGLCHGARPGISGRQGWMGACGLWQREQHVALQDDRRG